MPIVEDDFDRGWQPNKRKNAVVPLYYEVVGDNGPQVFHAGSGVLMTYGRTHFLCTAAHVISHVHEVVAGAPFDLLVGGSPTPFPIDVDRFVRNKMGPNETSKTDPFDFAAIELNREHAERLTYCRFVPLCLDMPWDLPEAPTTCVIGFRHENNSVNGRLVHPRALRLPLNLDPNFLLHDQMRKETRDWYIAGLYQPGIFGGFKSLVKGLRDFKGLSGGAWFYQDSACPGVYEQLAGVALEASVTSAGAAHLVGIRTRIIIETLHKWFPDLPPPKPPVQPAPGELRKFSVLRYL